MQGPEQYLIEMGAHLQCAVHPEDPAILDAAHRALVNHEAYFVGSDEAMQAFTAAPYRYTGRVTDPVSLNLFQPTETTPQRSFGNRLFFLETNSTATKFDENPTLYGTVKPMMRAKP